MRMGIPLHGQAVRGPARVTDAGGGQKIGVVFQLGLQCRQLARRLHHLEAARLLEGHAGRIVAPVFQTMQPLHQKGNGRTMPAVANDSAHMRTPVSGKIYRPYTRGRPGGQVLSEDNTFQSVEKDSRENSPRIPSSGPLRAAPRLYFFLRLLFLPASALRRACSSALLLRLAPVRFLAAEQNSAASRALIPLRPLFSLPPPKNYHCAEPTSRLPAFPGSPQRCAPPFSGRRPSGRKKDPLSEKNGSLS